MRRTLLTLPFVLLAIGFAQEPAKPKLSINLNLRGDRFPGLVYEDLTSAQKVIADRALAGRGPIGIFNITLRSPELSDAMRGIAGSRTPPALSPKQNELAILLMLGSNLGKMWTSLITIRHWTAPFAWYAHHRAGAQAGLSEAVIGAIAEGKRPAGLKPPK
jgi:hypothetical protein